MTSLTPSDPSRLEINKGDDFVFAVDVSGSMMTPDCPGGVPRIEFLKEKVIQFAEEASKLDENGIDVVTFGHQLTAFKNITAANAKDIISKLTAAESMTNTHDVINFGFKLHKENGNKQTFLMIATDGEPTNQEDVFKAIAEITHKVTDPKEFRIGFLTVGAVSPALRAFLTKLDDALPGAKAGVDIVDVKALADVDFIKAVAGALND
jgi:Mg-chelatase subunit ChlD